MRRFLWFVFIVAAAPSALADDPIHWGLPVNGLRLGLHGSDLTVTADQTLTFAVSAQNVGPAPIVLPTLDTFLLEAGRTDGFRATPLRPVLDRVNMLMGVATVATSSPVGPSVDALREHTVTLSPGQIVTWTAVPLGRSFFAPGPMIEPFHKAIVERSTLQRGCTYRLSYEFKNDQSAVAGVDVWTGRAGSGVIELTVNAPSTTGIHLDGCFSLARDSYRLGEPVTATFTVTNKGDAPIHFPAGGDYRATGRHDRFTVHAFDVAGVPVIDPLWWKAFFPALGGGLGGVIRLAPGETYHEDLNITQWCDFTSPGRYTVHLQRILNVMQGDPSNSISLYSTPAESLPAVPIASTLEVTLVEPVWQRLLHFLIGLLLAALGIWHITLRERATRFPGRHERPMFDSIFTGAVLCGIGAHYLSAATGLPVTGLMGGALALAAEWLLLRNARAAAANVMPGP